MLILDFNEKYRPALKTLYLESRKKSFTWLDTNVFRLSDFDGDTRGERMWIAIENERPVGFISVWLPENFIHHLYVHTDHINRGIGSLLLQACSEQIGRPMRLKCMTKNLRAIKFYKKHGWIIESEGTGENIRGNYYVMRFD